MKKYFVLSVVLVWSGFMGCTQAPALKIYSLNIPQLQAVPASLYATKTIKVPYPYSTGEELSQKMQFAYGNTSRGAYQNAQWSNSLGKLLQGTLVEVLDNSRLFKTAVLDTSAVREDYRIESTVFAFRHTVEANRSYALVSIQFTLVDTKEGQVLKSRRFSYQEATPTVDAEGYAKAVNVALSRLSRDLLQWLH